MKRRDFISLLQRRAGGAVVCGTRAAVGDAGDRVP
jgi:hypothetical protein